MNIPAALIASVVALSAAYMTGRVHGGEKVQRLFDAYKSQLAYDEIEVRKSWDAKAQEIDRDAQIKIVAARADARRVAATAASLRDQLVAIKAADPAGPLGCGAFQRERDELADLLQRSGELLARGKGIGDELAERTQGLQRHAAEVCGMSLK